MSETEILMEQQPPKEVFICDHAGFVINELSDSGGLWRPNWSTGTWPGRRLTIWGTWAQAQADFFIIDNLLVRIHLIIEMTLVDRPCAMGL